MRVKGLSPEITFVSEVDAVHIAVDKTLIAIKGQGDKSPTGSEAVSSCQRIDMNSGEPGYSQSRSMRQQVLKDKEPQKISRQSDYPIVSM